MTKRTMRAAARLCWPILLAATAARADDTEIFVSQGAQAGLRPNILFIVDTSGSMDGQVILPKAPYDPLQTYSGDCEADRVYFADATGNGGSGQSIPVCSSSGDRGQAGIRDRAMVCQSAHIAFRSAGFWTGRAAQWNRDSVSWGTISDQEDDESLECEADAGVHGASASSTERFAQNGDDNHRWTSNAAQQISWASATVYSLYSANWLNWYHAPSQNSGLSRLDVVKSVTASLASSIDGINMGLMRFSTAASDDGSDRAEGGMVTKEIENIATSRSDIINRVNSYSAGGFTPLSETMFEAGQYFAGRHVDYGVNSRIDAETLFPSVPESRRTNDQSSYQSPIAFQCQKNYAILLTDGEPTEDNSADDKITALPGFSSLVGSDCDGSGSGRCLDDMAEYLFKADLSPLAGRQNAVTYTIGFGPDVAGSDILNSTATRGGGRAFEATNVTELTGVLQQIFSDVLQSSNSFTAPSLSVNAFNRTQSTNEFYVSLFKPSERLHWDGNVKKYAIRNGEIVDSTGASAVDPETGFFRDTAQSLWSPRIDGAQIGSGGALSRQPAPGERKLYTWLSSSGSQNLTASGNAFSVANNALTASMLGSSVGNPTRDQIIEWAHGTDVTDRDADANTAENLPLLGDPLHARPVVLTYGGTVRDPDDADAVVFAPTNDGFLHAIDARSGRELWAFIPPELLDRLTALYNNPAVAARTYGLDGEIRLLRFDANQDGVLDSSSGDRAIVYFGMRRGGRHYYAVDVTNRASPRLLWSLGPSQLPGIGETWSQPTIARIRINGASQNGEKLVLVLGGGYDSAQENYSFVTDNSGNRIYIIDAVSGALLWYAGGAGGAGAPDLVLDQMRHSIPSRVTALDTDGDQFADRLYAGDMGGRVWRFDIFNGNSRSSLVTGGVIAMLGNGGTANSALASNRRFYNAPDVALIQRRGAEPYYNIAIGSGYRGHPLEIATRDRLYAIRDRNPFGRLTQDQYDNLTPITDGQFTDITDNPTGTTIPNSSPGWKLELRRNGGWIGEKVLADAVTINGTILFTTYQPEAAPDPCQPANGRNRIYALRVDNAAPALDLNDNQRIDGDDAFSLLKTRGIAGELSFLVESGIRRTGNNQDSQDVDELGRRSICAVGVEVLAHCVRPGSVVRTYWRRNSPDSGD